MTGVFITSPEELQLMEQNVGYTDKIFRILLGALTGTASLAILGGYLELAKIYSPILGVISLILLATAFTGRCGLYKALGMNTKTEQKQDKK